MRAHITVFESRHAGHTLGFAAEFARVFAAQGAPVTLVLNGAARGRAEVAETLGPHSSFAVDWMEPFDVLFASAEHGLRELELLLQRVRCGDPGRLVVPTGDAIARALQSLPQARAIEAHLPRMDIVLHHIAATQWPTGRKSLVRWRRGLAELKVLRRHRVLTCDAYSGLGPGWWASLPSRNAPTFIPHLLTKQSPWDRAGARAHFGLRDKDMVLVSTGDVARRKGIDRLVAAARHPSWPEELRLMLAGPVSAEMRPEIARLKAERPHRVVMIDRFLGEEEFAAAFLAADLVWAVTPTNLGISSTFLYAARFGRPAVIARSHRSAVWMCGRIGPGVATTLGAGDIARTVRTALALPAQTDKQKSFLDRITDPFTYEHIAIAE